MRRLIVHAHVPRCGASRLNRALFFRSYKPDETLLAYDDRFARSARLDLQGMAAPLAAARLALGHVPYGYFDGLGVWPLYVSVFDDPVQRFLSALGEVMAMPADVAAALLERDGGAPGDDADATAAALLTAPRARDRLHNAMTRSAAGLAPLGAPAGPEHLAAALANIARSNYFVAPRGDLAPFQGFLREVLGVGAGPRVEQASGWPRALSGGEARRARPVAAGDLSAATLARIEAANGLDMRLFEKVAASGVESWG